MPLGSVRERIHAANARLGGSGLRVLALAYRALPLEEADTVAADPMGAVRHLVFVGLVGIIDPLRPEAIEAVRVAHAAGIDVRMITGDHPATVRAIGSELGLGSGGLSARTSPLPTTRPCSTSCRTCTCSDVSRRRTSGGSCSSSRRRATWWR